MEEIHIGDLIKQRLNEIDRKRVWLAKQLNITSSCLYKSLKNSSMNTGLLVRISVILEYDFFARYSEMLKSKIGKN